MRGVARRLEYSGRPKARFAHVGVARLAHRNPLFSGLRNLMRYILRYEKNGSARICVRVRPEATPGTERGPAG